MERFELNMSLGRRSKRWDIFLSHLFSHVLSWSALFLYFIPCCFSVHSSLFLSRCDSFSIRCRYSGTRFQANVPHRFVPLMMNKSNCPRSILLFATNWMEQNAVGFEKPQDTIIGHAPSYVLLHIDCHPLSYSNLKTTTRKYIQ